MKKVILILASVSLILASCGGGAATPETVAATCCGGERKVCVMKDERKARAEFKAQWADFSNQTEEVQAELIAKKRACVKASIEKKQEKLAKKDADKRAECEEKIANCLAQLANFDNLTLEEQKAILDNCSMKKKKDKDSAKKKGCCSKKKAKN